METFLGSSGKMKDSLSMFHESRERRLKLLEERKSRYEESEHSEFTADEALIGLIIGKQGEKLTRVAREHKVEIRVLPDDNGNRRVRIYGPDRASVQRARSVLEYVYQEYKVPEGMVGWILGKRGGSIKDVSQKAGLHSAWFDDSNNTVLLCGLRHSVDHAVVLLNSHAQYSLTTAEVSGADSTTRDGPGQQLSPNNRENEEMEGSGREENVAFFTARSEVRGPSHSPVDFAASSISPSLPDEFYRGSDPPSRLGGQLGVDFSLDLVGDTHLEDPNLLSLVPNLGHLPSRSASQTAALHNNSSHHSGRIVATGVMGAMGAASAGGAARSFGMSSSISHPRMIYGSGDGFFKQNGNKGR